MTALGKALFEAMVDALAADTSWFGNTGNVKVYLIKEPFTPDRNAVDTDFSSILADFVTSTEKAPVIPSVTGYDPVSGAYIMEVPPPSGGWRWETTADTNLPQTIHGWYVRQTDGPLFMASGLLETPIELTAVNQVVSIPKISFTFNPALIG